MLRMISKLTLSIEQQVIENAKVYAKEQGRSLSKIIEEYLKAVSKKNEKLTDVHPLVEKLSGSLKLPKDKTYKEMLDEAKTERFINQ